MAAVAAPAKTPAPAPVPTRAQPFKSRKAAAATLQYAALAVIVVIVLTPIVLLVFAGLKTRGELATRPYSVPNPAHWENYVRILSDPTFWRMLGNSLIVMLATAALVLSVSSLAAFVFSRLRFRGRELLLNFFTLGLLFPLIVAILPVYIVLRQMGLLDNLWGVILPQVAFGLAGNIIILRGFFRAIPAELQDAAYIDGCSDFGFFWRILLPLARPALAAVAALVMIASWNELFLPLIVLNHDSLWTLPLGTMQFMGQYGQDQALISAFVTLSMIPTILFYLLAERQIVAGLTAGAVKG
jgi:raffinose/stachyose/melibiose transport system permease protein